MGIAIELCASCDSTKSRDSDFHAKQTIIFNKPHLMMLNAYHQPQNKKCVPIRDRMQTRNTDATFLFAVDRTPVKRNHSILRFQTCRRNAIEILLLRFVSRLMTQYLTDALSRLP